MWTLPERYIRQLIEISEKKYKLLEDMLILTMKQSWAIDEGRIELLGELINDKQSIIEEIEKLDHSFNEFFHDLKCELNVNSLDEIKNNEMALCFIDAVKELKELVPKVMELLKEIDEVDKANNDKAKHLLKSLGSEINKLNQGKLINSAYNSAPQQVSSFFIDKKK